MLRLRWVGLGLLLLGIAACTRGGAPGMAADADASRRIEADVRFLADDLLEGREAGTRGYDLAALYVAQRLRAMGLEPAGDNGSYFQRVPLLKATRLRADSKMAVTRDGATIDFAFESEYSPGIDMFADRYELTAPMVFVGQAVVAPERRHDDFAGVDVRGKIALLMRGAPSTFSNEQRAFYSSRDEKASNLSKRGAVAVVFLSDLEQEERYPWARGAANWARPSMRLRDENGMPIDSYPGLVGGGGLSVDGVRRLFEGAPHDADAVFAMFKADKLVAFDLPGTMTLSGTVTREQVESHNVVARLRGRDVALGSEHVVFTAHLDHVGIGAPINGDAIYNGAMDNALGVSIMLEVARNMAQGPKPRRSALFIALTAEEKGLLGAEWFARSPTVPRDSLVANINMDMPVLLGPRRDVLSIGFSHSDLGTAARETAATMGMELSPDPFPEEVVFVRSDQYAFVRHGVPALAVDGGVVSAESDVDGKAQLIDFLRTHYHQPSDQADLPIHYPAAATLARFNTIMGLRIANTPQRPRWHAGDFFGERFAPAGHPSAAKASAKP